jgi:hypothetical protein
MMSRWQGSLDRTIQHAARLRAATLTTRQIIAEIRGTIGQLPRYPDGACNLTAPGISI